MNSKIVDNFLIPYVNREPYNKSLQPTANASAELRRYVFQDSPLTTERPFAKTARR